MNRPFNKTETWFLLHWRDQRAAHGERDDLPPVQKYATRQRAAISHLINRGLVEPRHTGARGELHFKVNWSRLDEAISEAMQ